MNPRNSNKKKLKMERLSPIPVLEQSLSSSDSLHTPVRSGIPTGRRQKDAYAIETISSPEFGKLPVSSESSRQKPRRHRTVARSNTSKKPNSTPLSGLISRKTVLPTANESLHLSNPCSSPTSTDIPLSREGDFVTVPSELPIIDDYSPIKLPHSPRHSEIISASVVFPHIPQPGTSNTPPLAGIVNKRASNSNHSLNDSIAVLLEAEDPSDDEEVSSDTSLVLTKSNTEKVSIESFESPRKPSCLLSKELITSAGVFKNFHPLPQKNLMKTGIHKESLVVEKQSSNNVEMCGNERKNRKRALDFNSSTSMVMDTFENVHDGLHSPVLNLMPSLTCRDGRTVLRISSPNRDCHSPILNVVPLCSEPGNSRQFDQGSHSVIHDHESSFSVHGKRPKSPILNFMVENVRHGRSPTPKLSPSPEPPVDRPPVLNISCPSRNCESTVHDLKQSFEELKQNRLSPVLDFVSATRDLDRFNGRFDELPGISCQESQSRESQGDRQSPILNLSFFNPNSEPPDNHSSPNRYCELDSPSPILDLDPSLLNPVDGRQSPGIFNCSNIEPARGCGSPSLITKVPDQKEICKIKSPCKKVSEFPNFGVGFSCGHEILQMPVPNLTLSQPSKGTDFDRLCKTPEVNSPIEKQVEECPSDTDSIIESTPRRSINRDYDSCGFTASSCLKIENDSPLCTDGKVDHSVPKIEAFEETVNNKNVERRDLKLVVVSHDTSPDESDADMEQPMKSSCDMIFPTIEGRHSPVEFDFTKRPIQSFESPSKVVKPFSEAVNIGAFGSPDSNASLQDQYNNEEEGTTDEVIEPSTTQEYVEESEQVRPSKRRKRGSLLERVRGVIAKVDASNALFDYEMKCGLRPARGKFVSAPLVLLKKPTDPSSLFLICKPVKYCTNPPHVEDISSFVIVHVNKLPSGVTDGSVVVLHFPLNIMYFSDLHVPCVMAGLRIVPYPAEQQVDISKINTSPLESVNSLSSPYSKPMTSFRTFSSVHIRTLTEAALCQNLVEESNLYLTVLHVTKLREDGLVRKILALCSDEELFCCWLEFTSERDIKRAEALETLNILSDGSPVQTKGFSVVDSVRLDRKSKNLVSYCSNNTVHNEIIFCVRPRETDWVISSTDDRIQMRKIPVLAGDILSKKILGCRYLLEVQDVEKEPKIKLRDTIGQSIDLIIGENSSLDIDQPTPYFLDGVYFYDGKLYSDEHTRVIQKTVAITS